MAVIPSIREGTTRGLILFVGFIIVFAVVLIFLFVIRTVYGNFSATELVPDSNVLKTLLHGNEANIAVLHSDYTERMMPDNGKWLNDNHTKLEKFLNHQNNKFETITDKDIERGNHFRYDLIILPGSISLSDIEIIQIKKYLDKGGSIFATRGTAAYSDGGKRRGWNFLSDVFGLKYLTEVGGEDAPQNQILKGEIPITANIPTGYSLRVASRHKLVAVEILDSRTKPISFLSNDRFEEGLTNGEINKMTSMVYGNYGDGRFIWMGFDIGSVTGVHEDDILFERLFNNYLYWLLKKPIAFVKNWPSGYNAAAILSSSLNENPSKIKNLLATLNEKEVEATFFVEPDFANEHSDLIKTISKFGEIDSLLDVGFQESKNDTVNNLDANRVIQDFRLTKPEYQFNKYQKGIDRILFEGGLFLFRMNTDSPSNNQNTEVVNAVISDLKRKKFWIATSEEIQNWQRIRDYLKINSERRSNSRVSVKIFNSGEEVASRIIIYVDLNNKADQISIDTEVIGTKRAAFSHQRGSEIINLYIDDLQPNESRTFIIDFNQISS